MHHVPLADKCIYECSNKRGRNWDGKEGRELRLLGLLYLNDLVLSAESKEGLRAMVSFCWCVGEEV